MARFPRLLAGGRDPAALAVFVMGLMLIGLSARAMYHGFLVDYATPVPARILEMERYHFKANPDRPPKVKYRFSYEYEFRGRRHVSRRYSFRGDEGFHAYARFRAGDEATAWIDPEHPERAVIERGVSALNYLWAALGALMVGGAARHQWPPTKAGTGTRRWRRSLAAVQKRAGPAIGMTLFFGGIGYFIWALIRAGSAP
jgi:hypothetical protein